MCQRRDTLQGLGFYVTRNSTDCKAVVMDCKACFALPEMTMIYHINAYMCHPRCGSLYFASSPNEFSNGEQSAVNF